MLWISEISLSREDESSQEALGDPENDIGDLDDLTDDEQYTLGMFAGENKDLLKVTATNGNFSPKIL